MSRKTGRRDPLAGTRPTFFPHPGASADPARREQDLRAILAQPRQATPRRALVLRRLRPISMTVAAGALAVAVVVAGTVSNDPPEVAQPASARQVLLAAADAVADEEPASGRYWHVRRQYDSATTEPAAPGHGPYTVVTRAGSEAWISGTGREQSVYVHNLDVTTQPLTAEDEAEWKKAGTPAGGARPTPHPGEEPPAPEPARPVVVRLDGVQEVDLGGDALSLDELPTDAEALEASLLAAFRTNPPAADEPKDETGWLAQQAIELLGLPATPGTRAAAYRLLADLPGFRTMKDSELPDGAGVGVAREVTLSWAGATENATLDYQVIIDPDTGLLLTEQFVLVEPGTETTPLPIGTVVYRQTIEQAGWVDSDPIVPADATTHGG